jgi:hypothetical protein
MKYISILLLASMFSLQGLYGQVDSVKGYSKGSVKAFIENMARSNNASNADRETFRNQMKVLAITVFLALVGVALGKVSGKHKWQVLIIAVILDVGLYGIDTSLLDLSSRQLAFANRLDDYLLRWDTMSMAGVDSALTVARQGLEGSNACRKICLAFTFRLNDDFWYLFPLIGVLPVWILSNKEKQSKKKGRPE